MKKIVITGARGLVGWHASALVHAQICAARFKGLPLPFELVQLGHEEFVTPETLDAAVAGADVVLHFAGVNRGTEAAVESANTIIAEQLAAAIARTASPAHIVYANSTHAAGDTPYGRSKRRAGEVLSKTGFGYTNLVLPHIFGECARPYYNNVTATLIDQVIKGEAPTINPDGVVHLLHAGEASRIALEAGLGGHAGDLAPAGRTTSVPDLLALLVGIHQNYDANIFPDLSDDFLLRLFNSYRAGLYPGGFPRPLKLNSDPRGTLFEAVKGGGGGQSFFSWTEPRVTRGDHFHLAKVERFLVLKGEAIIRVRRVLAGDVWSYRVSGDAPAPVDMPTLHTHSIENVGSEPLLTMFWTHEVFDPNVPDTYADPVIGA